MALSIVECLATHGQIVQDDLAQRFARRMMPSRGAFFADRDLSFIVEQARLSAEVTHAHPERHGGRHRCRSRRRNRNATPFPVCLCIASRFSHEFSDAGAAAGLSLAKVEALRRGARVLRGLGRSAVL